MHILIHRNDSLMFLIMLINAKHVLLRASLIVINPYALEPILKERQKKTAWHWDQGLNSGPTKLNIRKHFNIFKGLSFNQINSNKSSDFLTYLKTEATSYFRHFQVSGDG